MEDGCIFLSPVTKTVMSFKKACLKICKQIPSFPPQAGVYFKEIVGFMVKKNNKQTKKKLFNHTQGVFF